MIRIVAMSAALTDKCGLILPIVRGREWADGTFLRTIHERNCDDEFWVTQGFIGRKQNDLSPRGGQNGPVEVGFRLSAVRQQSAVGIALGLRTFGHVRDGEIFADREIPGIIGD